MKNKEELEKKTGVKCISSIDGIKHFDICLMNPPYHRGVLELKVLEKVIEITDKVVSIQPVRWLQDPIAKYNKNSNQIKYENSISKHIEDLEIVTAEEAKKQFDILLPCDSAIYLCSQKGGYDYNKLSSNHIIDKVVDYIKENKCKIDYNKKDGYRIRIVVISGGKARGAGERPPGLTSVPMKNIIYKDGKYNGKWWYEYYAKNQYSKITEEITHSIKFNSEEEGHNFYKSHQTNFVRYIENILISDVIIDDNKILWMGNAKHPRTSTIGYKDEWTNEDFFKFFNISKEDQKMINDFIDKTEEDINNWFKTHNKKRK